MKLNFGGVPFQELNQWLHVRRMKIAQPCRANCVSICFWFVVSLIHFPDIFDSGTGRNASTTHSRRRCRAGSSWENPAGFIVVCGDWKLHGHGAILACIKSIWARNLTREQTHIAKGHVPTSKTSDPKNLNTLSTCWESNACRLGVGACFPVSVSKKQHWHRRTMLVAT